MISASNFGSEEPLKGQSWASIQRRGTALRSLAIRGFRVRGVQGRILFCRFGCWSAKVRSLQSGGKKYALVHTRAHTPSWHKNKGFRRAKLKDLS